MASQTHGAKNPLFERRIAFITGSLFSPDIATPIGGVGVIIRSVAKECEYCGARPVVVVDRFVKNNASVKLKRWVRDGIPVYEFPFLRSIPANARLVGKTRYHQLVAKIRLPQVLTQIKPELIYINVSGSGRLRFAYEIKRRLKSKIVGASHGLGGLVLHTGERYDKKDLSPRWIESVEAVDVWVSCGSYDKEGLLSWGIPAEKIVLINNGVYVPHILPPSIRNTRPKEQITIAYVGRMIEKKGIFDLADAVVELSKTSPDIRPYLRMAGAYTPGILHSLQRRLEAASGKLDYRFLGEVSSQPIEEILCSADIFCHPSKNPGEGLPLAILEAAASGCPMVLSDHPAHLSVYRPNVHALYHRRGDAKDLASAIDHLARNEDLRLQLRNNAYKLVKTMYNSDRMLEAYRALFERLLGKRSRM